MKKHTCTLVQRYVFFISRQAFVQKGVPRYGRRRPIAPTIGQAASIVGRQKRVHGQPLSHILYANAATV